MLLNLFLKKRFISVYAYTVAIQIVVSLHVVVENWVFWTSASSDQSCSLRLALLAPLNSARSSWSAPLPEAYRFVNDYR